MLGFISYAHKDYNAFTQLQTHLRATERKFGLQFWSDQRINSGYFWDASIRGEIKAAQVFVLLISPDFIASDYIYDQELVAIQRRRLAPEVLLLPVVLKRCSWQMICGAIQASPTDRGLLKPALEWRPISNGFDCIRVQIEDAIKRYYGLEPNVIDWSAP